MRDRHSERWVVEKGMLRLLLSPYNPYIDLASGEREDIGLK